MRMRRHFHQEESGAIDLAPMLDFVMNLLIFFIITTVFTKELALNVNRAGASGGDASGETSSVLVTVRGNGEIWIEDRIVDVRAVRANIERLHVQKPESGVLLVADKDAEAGVLVQVIDQVREGGVQNISFAGTR